MRKAEEFWYMWDIRYAPFNTTVWNQNGRIWRSGWSHPWRKHDQAWLQLFPFLFCTKHVRQFLSPPHSSTRLKSPLSLSSSTFQSQMKNDQTPHIKYIWYFKFRSHKISLHTLHFRIFKAVISVPGILFFLLLCKITQSLCFKWVWSASGMCTEFVY